LHALEKHPDAVSWQTRRMVCGGRLCVSKSAGNTGELRLLEDFLVHEFRTSSNKEASSPLCHLLNLLRRSRSVVWRRCLPPWAGAARRSFVEQNRYVQFSRVGNRLRRSKASENAEVHSCIKEEGTWISEGHSALHKSCASMGRAAEVRGLLEATLSTLLLALRFCFVGIRDDWSKTRTAGGWTEEEEEVEEAIILVGVEGQLWEIERGSMGCLNIKQWCCRSPKYSQSTVKIKWFSILPRKISSEGNTQR